MNRFVDTAELSGTRTTQDGFLVADCIVARTGIQLYSGAEMGLFDRPVVRVWRPESEVKDVASVKTYSHAPITMGHPSEMVTKDNWADLAKGEVGEEAAWEDGKLRLPLIVKDGEAIDAIKGGVRELSAGYTCAIDWTEGTTPDGERYDAVQRDIRINHVAIVPRGRAGIAKIGDAKQWGLSPTTQPKQEAAMADVTTVVAFDEAYDVNDAGARLHKRMQAALDASKTEVEDLQAKLDADAKAHDAKVKELTAAKDAAEQKAKDAEISPAQLNKMIADRKVTMDKAVALGLDMKEAEEMSEEDMKAAAVKKKMGDKAKDYDAGQFAAAFDVLEVPKSHPLSTTIQIPDADDMNAVYAARDAALSNAWKPKTEAK